jgi:glucokinase
MYLGIEIGGTKLQLGLGKGDGKLAALWRGNVDVATGADGIRRQILQAVPELLEGGKVDRTQVQGVGIGFGGPVDDGTHTVIKSHQIAGWDGFPLAEWISELLGWPAVLGNDADVAGLAEALFGAGKGLSPIFYITIGSGIGGGLIVDGEIYRGCGRGAAEIGHLRVWAQGQVWEKSPGYYPLEEIASGWAIGREAQVQVQRGYLADANLRHLVDDRPDLITARHVAQGAAMGNELSRAVLDRAWSALAEGICHVIALLCPRRIVIGGGVSLMGEHVLFEPLRRLVAERVFAPFRGSYDIVPAVLGEEVVIHGALALAKGCV